MTITTLAELIAQVESNGNKHAVRYEPNYSPHNTSVIHMMNLLRCNYTTARVACAMSWGKYQIMGDELCLLGLEIDPISFCEDDAAQDDFFSRYLGADHLSLTLSDVLTDPNKRLLFARLWNGPGNTLDYAARMVDVAKANGLEVVL